MAGQKKQYVAIGMMSGTSMDGIDIALIRTNGKSRLERGPSTLVPYKAGFRKKLVKALEEAKAIRQRDERPGKLAKLEDEIAERHVTALQEFLASRNLRLSDIDVLGMHGQTVLHRPDLGFTVQLGDGDTVASQTGIPVVHDLRANDMEHGGQGAPLAPAYHRALARNLPQEYAGKWPVAFVNIGGIANITWITEEGGMIAFDTGPGNALIDQWVEREGGVPYDQDGMISGEGKVVKKLANKLLKHPFFEAEAPKSLDRGDFRLPEPGWASLEDGARTLAHVTAAAIAKACEHLPERPRLWVICGGGRKNASIVGDLRKLIAERDDPDQLSTVITAEDAGFDGDMVEAEAWAYLAVRSLRELKITWPHTTGVGKAITGGKLAIPVREESSASATGK